MQLSAVRYHLSAVRFTKIQEFVNIQLDKPEQNPLSSLQMEGQIHKLLETILGII